MAKFTAGFTLVELTIVIAISGSLLIIALAGQRQLRSQATFDAAVDKVIATIGQAREVAVSGVNQAPGAGSGLSYVCPGNTAPSFFDGDSWEAYPTPLLTVPMMINVWVSDNKGDAACYFPANSFQVATPEALTITDVSGIGPPKVVFARHDGGFIACMVKDGSNPRADFSNSDTCSVGSGTTNMSLKISDAAGNVGIITINAQTGLACRAKATAPYACD